MHATLPSRARPEAHRFETQVARERAVVAQAQRLRDRVADDATPSCDDRFEAHCQHLVVRDLTAGEVIATCRVLSPQGAQLAGSHFAAREFDLALLAVLSERMVEIDPPCMDPRYHPGQVLASLWSGLVRYLIENGHDHVLACAGVSTSDGGHAAASAYRTASAHFLSPDDYRVFPRRRLPLENLSETRYASLPASLRMHLARGAWLCGEPAHDERAVRADFPLLMPLARMQHPVAQHYLERAA
jgi:putative hemolysin